jgi:hypothetical protein
MEETWIQNRWRPAMGWVYMAIVVFDFMIAPIFWPILQVYLLENPDITNETSLLEQWEPITLSHSGLFHVSMGGILGVTAWSRGQEKLNGVAGVIAAKPEDQEDLEENKNEN